MTHLNKKIAIFLDGPIKNDGRVRRIIETLSVNNSVHLFYIDGTADDNLFFNNPVELHSRKKTGGWLKVNLNFHKRFTELEEAFLMINEEFDFIYCNDYPLLYLCTKLKKRTKAKLIYDSHEIYIETINQFFPLKSWKSIYGRMLVIINKIQHSKIERKLVKSVDQMITVCDSFKNYFSNKYAVENILVIKNCPKDVDEYKQTNILREQLALADNDKILLYQGDVNISRGIEKTINALQLLDNTIHFVVVGGGTKLEEFKNEYKQANIHFIGKIPFEDLYDYTRSCDIGIMLIESFNLSKMLTLPNKAFEYMIAGKPFITNQLPEVSKIVKEENCGFVIDDSTIELVAKGISEAFLQPNLNDLGRNGYNAIVKKYHWEKEVEKLINYISL